MRKMKRSITALWLMTVPAALASCSATGSESDQPAEALGQADQALSALSPALTGVPAAQTKVAGNASPNFLSPELIEVAAAQGSNPLENPTTVVAGDGTLLPVSFYGYSGNGPMLPAPGDVQSTTHNVESTKTEPDKNTYLVLFNQTGADPSYNYGTHFLFQGHENAARAPNGQNAGYISRINLDADGAHRVTLLASTDVNGSPLPVIDGSTWDPFAQKLIFSTEGGPFGGLYQATASLPSTVTPLLGITGQGGFEGVQNDINGNLWIVEDAGGPNGVVNPHAKQPNSFLYRFVPTNVADLTRGGKLQALQVISRRTSTPIVFHAGQADADILSDDTKDLNTYGLSFVTHWVTIHDTAVDGTAAFSANAAAKAHSATPFKRPENGQFRPGTNFREFFFDATGDTDSRTEAGSTFGGFGGLFKLVQRSPSANDGTLSLFYNSDVTHSGFDNCAFWDRNHIVFVEDAGDTLHTQRNALDSAFLFDVTADYSQASNVPLRILAEGRDPSATIDSALGALGAGFQNDGDNELTGFHVSNGDASVFGLLGAGLPRALRGGWRVFYTAQHGDNVTWEILSKPAAQRDD